MKEFRATYAYNYVQNGWLGYIYSIIRYHNHFDRSTVSPSQPGQNSVDYHLWVAAISDGTIKTGKCKCPAGEGRSCSHIAAVMYAVHLAWLHEYACKSPTDIPCSCQ